MDEKVFIELKGYLMTEPILRLPNFTKKFYVTTDACKDGLGAVLTQQSETGEYAVCYASRITSEVESRLCSFELECLGVLFALKIFRCYLLHSRFTLYTDNNAVVYLMKNRDTSSKLMRWSLKLQEFDMEIVHKAVKKFVWWMRSLEIYLKIVQISKLYLIWTKKKKIK